MMEDEQATEDSSKPYKILPDGKKHYTRATTVDIVISALIPFWGIVIGAIAASRGEVQRGKTMMIVGGICLLLVAAMQN